MKAGQSWLSLGEVSLLQFLGFCGTGLGEIYEADATSLLCVISGWIESWVQLVPVSYLCDGPLVPRGWGCKPETLFAESLTLHSVTLEVSLGLPGPRLLICKMGGEKEIKFLFFKKISFSTNHVGFLSLYCEKCWFFKKNLNPEQYLSACPEPSIASGRWKSRS